MKSAGEMLQEMWESGLTEQAISDLTPMRRVKFKGAWVERRTVSQVQVHKLRSGEYAQDPRASTWAAVNDIYLKWKADQVIAQQRQEAA